MHFSTAHVNNTKHYTTVYYITILQPNNTYGNTVGLLNIKSEKHCNKPFTKCICNIRVINEHVPWG